MAISRVDGLGRRLCRLAMCKDAQGVSDGDLLERFVSGHDELAFESLLRRHSRMVMGVCQRVVGNVHDAEDAFQATFLVLLNKAQVIWPREQVGNWLYGVAYRTALQARSENAKRRSRQRAFDSIPHPEMETSDCHQETMRVLHQELHRLPDKYRTPILLCDVEGKTRREAADILGLPGGTLSNRLAKARALLGNRLARRGFTLSSSVAVTALLAKVAEAGVCGDLLANTGAIASRLAAGNTAVTGASSGVLLLATKVIKTMFRSKLQLTAAPLLLAILVAASFWFAHTGTAALVPDVTSPRNNGDHPTPKNNGNDSSINQKSDHPGKAGRIYVYLSPGIGTGLATMKPDGTNTKHFPSPTQEKELYGFQTYSSRLAPNKRHLAFGNAVQKGNGIYSPEKIYLRDITKQKGIERLVDMTGGSVSNWFWSPDGNKLAFTAWDGNGTWRNFIVDIKTKKTQTIKLPAFKSAKGKSNRMSLQAWSPDGKWFLTHANGVLLLVKTDGSATRQLTKTKRSILMGSCRFSRDGRKLLYVTVQYVKGQKNRSTWLWVTDVASGKTKKVVHAENFTNIRACWSPDSRRIAYSVMFIDDKGKRTGESNLNVIDADGGNSVTIHRIQSTPGVITIELADWR